MSCKIKDLCIKIGSGGTPSRKNKSYYECGSVKWLKTKELNDTIIYDTEEKITEEALSKSSAKIFPKNTVVMAMYGATVGKLGILGDDISTNQACCNMVLNEKVCNYKFLYYSLIYNRENLINLANGAAQQNLNVGIIGNYEIDRPDLEEQEKIANILSSLDDKIELNNEMNKTLEEMAQALFKRWFVDFEFPNENGEPYKSSGGEMVESELGMIPKGWEVKEIKDFGDVITGKTPSTKNKSNYGDKYPFITIPDMHNIMFINKVERYLSELGHSTQPKKLVPKNSIIVSCIATVGLVSINSVDSHTNQQINSIVPNNKMILPYLFFNLKSKKEFLNNLGSGGTTTKNVNKTQFESIRIIRPLNEVTNKFYYSIYSSLKMIEKNIEENYNLIEIRDTLLPKLMSGEIRVK